MSFTGTPRFALPRSRMIDLESCEEATIARQYLPVIGNMGPSWSRNADRLRLACEVKRWWSGHTVFVCTAAEVSSSRETSQESGNICFSDATVLEIQQCEEKEVNRFTATLV